MTSGSVDAIALRELPGQSVSTVPPPDVFDALEAPDAVARFALDQGPRADTLPVLLIAIESGRLSDVGQIDAVAALDKYKSSIEAAQLSVLADVSGRDTSGKEYVREEIAAALRISPSSAHSRLELARALTTLFPGMARLLASGRTTVMHARVLVESTGRLRDDADARSVETLVLDRAAEQTVGQFRKTVERAVLRVDAATAEQRHEMAAKDRRVAFRAVSDGMAELYAYLPLDRAAAAKARIDALAAATEPADGRTSDQRRADVLCDALAGIDQPVADLPREHGLRPSVQVIVSLETLGGASDAPGELAGFGPIPAWLARRIAADPTGTWRRLVTDRRGRLLDYGRTTYRPPADLAQHVIARDRTCGFPGCARAARRCDLDHCTDWADGGHTNPANLHALCPRHHQMKHETGWRYTVLPDGDLEWTSTTDRTYRQRAQLYPTDPDPPPF